jgi:hypothetical protein
VQARSVSIAGHSTRSTLANIPSGEARKINRLIAMIEAPFTALSPHEMIPAIIERIARNFPIH